MILCKVGLGKGMKPIIILGTYCQPLSKIATIKTIYRIIINLVRENDHSNMIITGNFNMLEEEIRKNLTSSKALSISSHDGGTRVQSNKWSCLDYFLSELPREQAVRYEHVSKSDHSSIGINVAVTP